MVAWMPEAWIPTALVFAASASVGVALVLAWILVGDLLKQRAVRSRMAEVMGSTSGGVGTAAAGGRSGEGSSSPVSHLLRMDLGEARELPVLRRLRGLLEQADVGWSAGRFFLVSFCSAVGAAVVAGLTAGGTLLPALAFTAGMTAPYLYLRRRVKKIREEFEENLPDALDLLTRAIRAGHPLTAGMAMVGEEGPPRVAREFRITVEEHRFGLPFEDALLGMVDRVDVVDVRIFATAILIQRESGGNLAEILQNLGKTIRDRFSVRRQLRTHTAQGRMSGYVLAALPIVVAGLIHLLEPDYVSVLFEEMLGQMLLACAALLQVMGFLWIRKIVDIDI